MHHLLDVGRFTLGRHHNGIEYSPILILMRMASTFPGLAFASTVLGVGSFESRQRNSVRFFLNS
jgi:hypothetical protein